MDNRLKFLIVRLSSLGDVIHSLPLVHRLRQNYPEAQIDWLVGKKGFELLSLINELDNIYLLNLKNFLLLQKQKYDFVIDVQGLFKSAFLSRLSLGQKIIGFKNTREFADIFYNVKIDVGNLFKTKKHIIDLNLELISPIVKNLNSTISFLIPKIEKPDNKELLNIIGRKSNFEAIPLVVLFPATTWESKLWPMDYWFELITNICNKVKIFLCASTNDLQCINQLVNKLDANKITYFNLVGKTNIKDLIYLLQNVNLVVGLDSAPLHLASGIKNDYGSPNIMGIYGPTSPVRTGPYNLIERCLYLSELECIACRKKTCPLGHHNCMNNIIPLYVKDRIESELKNSQQVDKSTSQHVSEVIDLIDL